VVIDAVRTPYGRRGGALSGWHPVDLGAELLVRLAARNHIDAELVDEVIFGCATQVGSQAANLARRAVLAAGWPEQTPAETVGSHAGSSLWAVQQAAQAVAAGALGLVVAGGIEVMTKVPLGANLAVPATGKPFGQRLQERYPTAGGLLPPGLAAEEVARRWSLSRSEMDAWAYASRSKAARSQRVAPPYLLALATSGGRTEGRPPMLERDEALSSLGAPADLEALAPTYLAAGSVTAANMAAEGDGAAAVLIASARRAQQLGLVPMAVLRCFATAAEAPDIGPTATVPATRALLRRAGLTLAAVGRYEVFESSAAAVLAWAASTGADPELVNPDGGALATTAPVGAAGAGLLAAAVASLSTRRRYSLVTVAGDGGVASACLLESP
jgi:acetyl-CoA acetyltransferase family protein